MGRMITNYQLFISTGFDRVHGVLDKSYHRTRSHFNKFVNSKYKNIFNKFHSLQISSQFPLRSHIAKTQSSQQFQLALIHKTSQKSNKFTN